MPRWRAGRVGCLAAGHSPLLSLSIAGGRLGSEKAGRDSEKAGRERQASRPVVADPSRESESRAPSSGSESLIRVADPSHIRVSDLSRTSESHPSRTSESHIRVAHQSQIRVADPSHSGHRKPASRQSGCQPRLSAIRCRLLQPCVCVCVRWPTRDGAHWAWRACGNDSDGGESNRTTRTNDSDKRLG